MGAIYQTKQGNHYLQSIEAFHGKVSALSMEVGKRLEEYRMEQRQQMYDECKIDFASVDQAKEELANLAPAEKARVLRNAMRSMNMVGWPRPQGGAWPVDQIVYNDVSPGNG